MMTRAALFFAMMLGLGQAALALEVPAVSCEGQNCMQDEGRETKECEGQDCAQQAPQPEIECVGQDCDAIQGQPQPADGDQD